MTSGKVESVMQRGVTDARRAKAVDKTTGLPDSLRRISAC